MQYILIIICSFNMKFKIDKKERKERKKKTENNTYLFNGNSRTKVMNHFKFILKHS